MRGLVMRCSLFLMILGVFLGPSSVEADVIVARGAMKQFSLYPGMEPFIRRAARRMLAKGATRASVDNLLRRLSKDSNLRTKFAPYLLIEGFNAIKAKKRTADQALFYKFLMRSYIGYQRSGAGAMLSDWMYYKDAWNRKAREKDARGGPTLTTLSSTGPPLDGFKLSTQVIKLGQKGHKAIGLVLAPKHSKLLDGEAASAVLASAGLVGHGIGSAVMLAVGGKITAGFLAVKTWAIEAGIKAAEFSAVAGAKAAAVKASGLAGAVAKVFGSSASSVGLGVLIALPILIGGIVKTVEVVQAKTFEDNLRKMVKHPPPPPNLREIIFAKKEDSASLCYTWCKKGYEGVGPVCWQNCPRGYTNDGATCRRNAHIYGKPSYTRKTYPLWKCKGKQKQGALCYPWCKKGYVGKGPVCWGRCKKGYKDDGATCRVDVHIFARKSYGRGVGKVAKKCVKASYRRSVTLAVMSYMLLWMVGRPADAGVTFTRSKKISQGSKAPAARAKAPAASNSLLPGLYKVQMKHGGRRYLSQVGGGYGVKNVQVEGWKGWNTQYWRLHAAPGGYYKIEVKHGGKRYLTQVGRGYGVKNVQVEGWKGWNTQYWRLIRVGK